MKIVPLLLAATLLAGPALAGYRELKREMDAYAPPAMLHAPEPPAVAAPNADEDFRAAVQTIQRMRERWEAAINDPAAAAAHGGMLPTGGGAAIDDGKARGMLQAKLTLEVVQTLIRTRNPAVKAAEARLRAALEGFDQVAGLEEILRQYSAYTEGVMPGVGPMVGMETVRTTFPFPGVVALKGQVVEKNVAAQKETLDLVYRDNLAQALTAYWDLVYTHQAQRITREMRDRLNHLESVATTRYGAGKTSYQDVVKIRMNRERLVDQLVTLSGMRTNQETALLSLFDLAPGAAVASPSVHTPERTLPTLEPLYALALEKRQELKRMRAMVGKMERMIEMAETMNQPPFTQNAALFTDEAILQSGSGAMKPSFGTTVVPARGKGVPENAWFGSREAYLRETRRNLEALRTELTDAEARTRMLVRSGWFDLERALRERRLYTERLQPLAETALDVSTREYASGRVAFADVIGAYNGWLETRLAGERRNSDLGIVRAELARRIGAPLP